MTGYRLSLALAAAALCAAAALAPMAAAQDHSAHSHGSGAAPPASARYTMEALHAAGGVPPGWRFTIPAGDAAAGRQAFVDLKCYACHAIQGERFPLPPGEAATAGPELTGMGRHHPAEYLAESIVNPSAVLVDAPGYIGGDGRSIMPPYPDMTLAQLMNLVAYLKTVGGAPAHGDAAATERVAGAYRVRLLYRKPEEHHHQGGAAPMPPPQAGPGQLMAFVSDTASGQPLPYSIVKARIETPSKPVRTVTLSPAIGPEGFHYGASVDLPEDTARITVSIGPTSMRLPAGSAPGLKRPQAVTFEWK